MRSALHSSGMIILISLRYLFIAATDILRPLYDINSSTTRKIWTETFYCDSLVLTIKSYYYIYGTWRVVRIKTRDENYMPLQSCTMKATFLKTLWRTLRKSRWYLTTFSSCSWQAWVHGSIHNFTRSLYSSFAIVYNVVLVPPTYRPSWLSGFYYIASPTMELLLFLNVWHWHWHSRLPINTFMSIWPVCQQGFS